MLGRKSRRRLMCGAAALALTAIGGAASAQDEGLDIAPQPLALALKEFGVKTGRPVLYGPALAESKVSPGVADATDPDAALVALLDGTGLTYRRNGETYLIVQQGEGGGPQSAGAGGDVDALIVTAQKREENIQDVPIAISAFSQEDLTTRQVAGGPDLMTQVPNMTFTKTNFSSYSIQLRGIGTQAISATTDPAVAVAFNNTPFVRNRFFEQEFYDLQRVEVLRGPQGTLYGRNATAGVVNIISAKPSFRYEAKASADVANYNSTRVEGMLNLPLVEDAVGLRLAAAWTKREGYSTNQITGNPIDGRDLWSTRLSLRLSPSDRIDANLIWEHFEEDDDRLRSGKQLCKTHVQEEVAGFTESGGTPLSRNAGLWNTGQGGPGGDGGFAGAQAVFSQGCAPASLYSTESFQTPNGYSLPYYLPLGAVFLPTALSDPYVSRSQSHDLRVIESTVDPTYRAKSDVFELQASFDLTDDLSISSETAYATDFLFSSQDYNRFNTASGAWRVGGENTERGIIDENGFFCDPQIGCADRLVAIDLSTATSRHFSQEFRLASNFDGPFNFSLGGNFLRYDTEDKYYVFINSLTIISAISPYGSGAPLGDAPYVMGETDNHQCLPNGPIPPDPNSWQPILTCTYIDPNPIESLNDLGHNYFLSRNPYKLISYAAFGEAYYNITDDLKLTAGLRWTVDKKEAPLLPSWILASDSAGYPRAEVLEQEWREPTGRLTIDWKPDFSFTDESLLYASYAHGYKAGGANPPTYGKAIYGGRDLGNALINISAAHPKTFGPEFVDAFEVGSKNTLMDGRLTLNLGAFYYDYTGYQISQIIDRSASNLNYDATVFGVEIEADWRPLENLKLGFKGGYEDTRVADGMRAIDIMDRTAGHKEWVLVHPFPGVPSNCIIPAWLYVGNVGTSPANPELVNVDARAGGNPSACDFAYALGVDPVTREEYVLNPPDSTMPFTHTGVVGSTGVGINYAAWSTDMADYPGWPEGVPLGTRYPGWDPNVDYGNNHGEGFFKDLSGKELPNAPHFTATITADYTLPLPNDWLATLHTDLYYQSEAWTRIFNTEGYDKLKAYTNVNLAAIFTNDEAGWKVMAYVKNVFDRDSITGAFLNSDDSGLTTNVFLTEPRLYGIRVTKDWTGGPWWTGVSPDHTGPYPLTVELGGQIQRHDIDNRAFTPGFMDDSFPSEINPLTDQEQDLDWGDGRSVKVTWAANPTWDVSLGVRFGKTNKTQRNIRMADEGVEGCAFKYFLCDYGIPLSVRYASTLSEAYQREAHAITDFTVGRDIGIGLLGGSSRLEAGLTYAQFDTVTDVQMYGLVDWVIPENASVVGATHTRHEFALDIDREFSGAGPRVAWQAEAPLLGDEQTGHLYLDWAISGGVLFGKQKTKIEGQESTAYYDQTGIYFNYPLAPIDDPVVTPLDASRSSSVTVPTLDLSLGLSYEIQRIKIGAGYRWERYFDVLDGGYDEHKDVDRTIDGPYFKVSVGFGG